MTTENPIVIFNEIFKNTLKRLKYITTLLYISDKLPILTKEVLFNEQLLFSEKIISDEKFFVDKNRFLVEVGGTNGLADLLTKNTVQTYEIAIESSCLIFIHTILDNLVNDLIEISIILSPDKWIDIIKNSEIKIEFNFNNIINTNYDEIINEFYNKKYHQVKKKSLPDKIDYLHKICNLSVKYESSFKNYTYDKDKIILMDKTRHEIVHGKNELTKLNDSKKDIDFLNNTTFYLLFMFSKAFNLKING